MNDVMMFGCGMIAGIVLMIILIMFVCKYMNLVRVNYSIVLKNEDNVKLLNTFSRIYWKRTTAENDIQELLNECDLIRSDFVGGKDFILSLINPQFEIDYKQVHLEYEIGAIQPK